MGHGVNDLAYPDYFQPGSLWKLLRGENPYTFVETYELLTRSFGYGLHYVNYGLWVDGLDTVEPGRELTRLLGRKLGLAEGDRVIEAGSGLGQSAVDLCRDFGASKVFGMNICEEQVAFANALADQQGLADRIEHRVADACTTVHEQEARSFDHAVAQECIGHFPDPDAYLTGLSKLLLPGGRMAFTLVTSPKPPPKSVAYVQDLFFGVVPESGPAWEERFARCGFTDVQREDITEQVFVPLFAYVRRALERDSENMSYAGPGGRLALRALLNRSENAVQNGTMAYEVLVGQVP